MPGSTPKPDWQGRYGLHVHTTLDIVCAHHEGAGVLRKRPARHWHRAHVRWRHMWEVQQPTVGRSCSCLQPYWCHSEQTYRHHMLRDLLLADFRSRCKLVGVQKENSTPFVAGGFPDKQMDIVIGGGQMCAPLPMNAAGVTLPLSLIHI